MEKSIILIKINLGFKWVTNNIRVTWCIARFACMRKKKKTKYNYKCAIFNLFFTSARNRYQRHDGKRVIASTAGLSDPGVLDLVICIGIFVGFFVAPRVRLEVGLDLQERHALRFGHPEIAEKRPEKRDHGVPDKVGLFAERVRDGLVDFQHEGGRQRDGEHDHGVGQTAGVGREVLTLDYGHERYEPDVDEELGAADAGHHKIADAHQVLHRQQDGQDHVTYERAHARHEEQRPPAVSVHGQGDRHARHNDEYPEHHGTGVRRQPGAAEHGRRVRLHHAGAAGHLYDGQRQYDDQWDSVSVKQVLQFSAVPADNSAFSYNAKGEDRESGYRYSNYSLFFHDGVSDDLQLVLERRVVVTPELPQRMGRFYRFAGHHQIVRGFRYADHQHAGDDRDGRTHSGQGIVVRDPSDYVGQQQAERVGELDHQRHGSPDRHAGHLAHVRRRHDQSDCHCAAVKQPGDVQAPHLRRTRIIHMDARILSLRIGSVFGLLDFFFSHPHSAEKKTIFDTSILHAYRT